jgi:hypothetical protein
VDHALVLLTAALADVGAVHVPGDLFALAVATALEVRGARRTRLCDRRLQVVSVMTGWQVNNVA